MKAPAQTTGLAQLVTVHVPFIMGGSDVFAVRAGAPLLDALDGLSMLIDAARGVSAVLASIASSGDVPIDPAACWAPVYLLDAASALQAAIPAGTALHQTQEDAP